MCIAIYTTLLLLFIVVVVFLQPLYGVSFVEEIISLVSVLASGSVILRPVSRVENHKEGTFYSSAIGFPLFVAVALCSRFMCIRTRVVCFLVFLNKEYGVSNIQHPQNCQVA